MRISIEEAEQNFRSLLERVRDGEEVTLVDKGRVVAVMHSPGGKSAAQQMRELRQGVTLGISVRQALAEGRRY